MRHKLNQNNVLNLDVGTYLLRNSAHLSKGPVADLVKCRCRLLATIQAKFGEGVLGLAPCHFDWKINEEKPQVRQRDV